MKIILDQKKSRKMLLLGLLFLQFVWVLVFCFFSVRLTSEYLWGKLKIYENLETKVQAAVQEGIVLSDDYMDLIVLSNEPIYYQPFEYGELYFAGVMESDPICSTNR